MVRKFEDVWSEMQSTVPVPPVSVIRSDQLYRLCSSVFDLGRRVGHAEADDGLRVDGTPRAADCEPADQLFGGGS